jgi:hypothetical protein
MAANYECDLLRNMMAVEYANKGRLAAQLADPNTRACLKALWEEYFDSATAEQMIGLIAETEAGQETKRNVLLIGAAAGAAVASVLCILLLRGR